MEMHDCRKNSQASIVYSAVKIATAFFLLQLAKHLNARSNTVKTALDGEEISQGWFFST